jgi:hypothetical protein
MDPLDRLERIAELGEQTAEGRANLEQRQAAHDPAAELEAMIAEHKPVESLVKRETNAAGLLYREHDNNAPAHAPQPVRDASWNAWFTASFENHIEAEREATAEAIGEVVDHVRREMRAEFGRELANLQAENRELRGMLGDVLKRLEAVSTEVERAFGDHTAITRGFEIELAELRGRVNGIIRDGYG